MNRVYGDPVEVQAREDGRPARFAWRGRRYAVRDLIDHWVVNREWWQEPGPVPELPELEFWLVEAVEAVEAVRAAAGQGQPAGSYELRRDVAAGTWTLRRVTD